MALLQRPIKLLYLVFIDILAPTLQIAPVFDIELFYAPNELIKLN